MITQYVILVIIIIVPLLIGVLALNYSIPSEEKNKVEAQKIIDFRNADHTCIELSNLYLKYYPIKYDSHINLKWYWEITDKLVGNECITKEKLNNLESIEICMDGRSINCAESKLTYPELYENFNFKDSIKENINQSKVLDQ